MRFRYILLIAFLLPVCCLFALPDFSIKTVVIDAGHGGKDPGATGPGHTNEKDVALAVALKLGNYIKKNYPDINVIYTRKTDEFVELHERADIANRNKADLFIAIHCNSSPNSDAYGTSTYVLGLHRTEANLEVAKRENAVILLEDDRAKNYEFDPNSAEGHIIMSMKQNAFLDQSIDMASKMETQYENGAKRKSLGVKQAGFYVLYKTTMPSLLSEIGFISNPDEEKYLKSTKGQDEIAESVFSAFQEYKAGMESGTQPTKTAMGRDSGDASTAAGAKYITVPVADDYATLNNGTKIKKPAEGSGGGGVAGTGSAQGSTTAAPVQTPVVQTPPPVQSPPVAQTPVATPPPVKTETVAVQPPPVISTPVAVNTPPPVVKDNTPPPVVTQPETPPPPVQPVVQQKVTPVQAPPADASTATASNTVNKVPDTEVVSKPVRKEVVTPAPAPVKAAKTETNMAAVTTKPEPKIVKTEPKPITTASVTPTKVVKQPVAPPVKEAETGSYNFKVQLFALKNPLKDADRAKMMKLFKNIDDDKLSSGVTRYCVGNTGSFSDAKRMLSTAISNGYSDAFIVGTKNGKRMTPDEMKAME